MSTPNVPDIVIGRLPIYLRALTQLAESDQEVTSSQELGQKLGISSAQIRKDLSHFGEFGKQGTGYEISYLRDQISQILHVDRDWQVALIGVGDLGHALAHYEGFVKKGFHICALFDNDPKKIGQNIAGKKILGIEQMPAAIREASIVMAIIAVPGAAAQEVADLLVEAGVRAILNYAPTNLKVPEYVCVQHIDPVLNLQRMTYYLA